MMYRLLVIFLLFPLFCDAQFSKNIDSLFIVKDYLMDISNTVRSKENNETKIDKLGNLIRSATFQKGIFNRNIAKIGQEDEETDRLIAMFNLSMQSMVLYRSDLLSNFENKAEADYLNEKLAILMYKIYFYCDYAKRLQLEKPKK